MTSPSPGCGPGRPSGSRPDPARPPSAVTGPAGTAALVACAGCVVHGLALLGIGGFYLWEVLRGEQDSVARALTSVLLIGVVAGGLGLLARGWRRGAAWARTPTLVWNALLVPVAWSLFQAAHPLVGAAVGGTAVVVLLAAWRAGSLDDR